jgi:trans-4-hydroxy-L-proline dehydratase
MNERVKILRQRSLDAEPTIAIERALIVTDAYKEFNGKVSIPMMRALAFKALMENKEICINEGELIVGERGPKPKATPTYPELCCHTIEDFEIIDKREKTYFRVSEEALASHRDVVIPYWEGKSIRDLLLSNMTQEWLDCYYSGLFTEFMEQRAPGHTVADDKIYKRGMLECIQDIDEQMKSLDYNNDADVFDKQEELKAMRICAEAIITYSKRHADKAMQLAEKELDTKRKAELLSIAEVCNHIPGNAPRSFREALQTYWFMHLGVITELNTWDAFCPGRLDQHLYPFYKKEIEAGTLTEEQAIELLELFWIKFNNQPAPPKVGVTLAESGTYTDFANINNGGLRVDGSDGVNDVTYLILKVIDEMRLLQPSSNIQLSKKNPDRFLKNAARIIAKGWGQPSIFNADAVIEELIRQGKSIEDARCGGTSGCVEAGAFGKEAYILTGYFNLVKVMEIALNNGIDPRTGKQLGIKTGDPRQFRGYEDLLEAYKKQVHHFIEIKVRGNAIIETLYAKYMPSPFLSILIDDCIKRGKDYNAGGARYNSNYIQGVGIGTLADSFAAIKLHVFENRTMTMEELLEALNNNFEGNERARQLMLNKTPKYGNDDEYADNIMNEIFDIYYNEVNGRKTVKGGTYRIDMLPTTCHVYFGSVTGATPDGRKSGMPQSEGISPVQGSDINGPTGVIKSAAKMDHLKTGGTLLNLKFTPGLVQNEDGIDKLAHLVRSYFKLDGHHIQFNVVDAETLRKAQMNPEQYKDLIVRVAGYSDYFCDLSGALQNEIIARTEHKEF